MKLGKTILINTPCQLKKCSNVMFQNLKFTKNLDDKLDDDKLDKKWATKLVYYKNTKVGI